MLCHFMSSILDRVCCLQTENKLIFVGLKKYNFNLPLRSKSFSKSLLDLLGKGPGLAQIQTAATLTHLFSAA